MTISTVPGIAYSRDLNAHAAEHAQMPGTGSSTAPMLMQEFKRNRGGSIGVGSTKGVVAIRFDDWLDSFDSEFLAYMTARGLPCSIALITDWTANAWSSTTTWAKVKDWCFNKGVEILIHGIDHKDYIGYQGLYGNVVTAKETVLAQDIPVAGWAIPGVTKVYTTQQRGNAEPFNALTDISHYNSIEGDLITKTYAHSQAYASSSLLSLPSWMWHGSGHYTLNVGTLVTAKALIDEAYLRKGMVRFMTHCGEIGAASNMTLADWLAVMDYIVQQRDAGLIEVVCSSSFPVITRDTNRLDLLTAGDFLNVSSSNKLRWNNIDDGTTNRVFQTGGPSGGPYLEVITSGPNQRPDRLASQGLAGGTYVLSGLVSSGGAGTTNARFIIQSYPTADTLNINWLKSSVATGSWTPFSIPFTIPIKSNGSPIEAIQIFPHRTSGASTLWANLKCQRV